MLPAKSFDKGINERIWCLNQDLQDEMMDIIISPAIPIMRVVIRLSV